MFLGEEKIMNDLILSKMREGDWGEVVRLMRAEYGGSPDPAPTAPRRNSSRQLGTGFL